MSWSNYQKLLSGEDAIGWNSLKKIGGKFSPWLMDHKSTSIWGGGGGGYYFSNEQAKMKLHLKMGSLFILPFINNWFSFMRTNCSLGYKRNNNILFTNISSFSLFVIHILSLPLTFSFKFLILHSFLLSWWHLPFSLSLKILVGCWGLLQIGLGGWALDQPWVGTRQL